MMRRFTPLVVVFGLVLTSISRAQEGASSQKAVLLNVSAGQIPGDTGMDDKTKPEIVELKELGGKALKVAFAAGDSFGGNAGANRDWKQFAFLRFDVFNPSGAVVALEVNVGHARSSSYQTRIAVPVKLKPGKNEVKLGIDEMVNVNGSAPDLAHVVRWFIVDANSKGPTLYFSDIWPEGAEAPGTPAAGPQPLVGYRVKGTIGGMAVDLTVTPFALSGSSKAPASANVHGDPARVARIRATKMPKFNAPISFDTPDADAIVSALEVFPPDNPWNLDVSDWPLHPNSKNIIASIGTNKPLRYNPDMGYVLVPPSQKKVDVKLTGYAGESDPGPFPVPDNVPIEGWPVNYLNRNPKVTLEDVQRDTLKEDGDRHALVVDPIRGMLYEFYQLRKTDSGWQAAQSSIFNLKSNKMRPDGWTSSDAAGLPIFPSVVRYDELKRGAVEHALRVSVVKTRREYVYPATHYASRLTDPNLPRMGERIRLRKDFDVSGFSRDVGTILKCLQKYGMFVADNGIDWAVSVAPDARIPVLHAELRKVQGKDFEVVQTPTGYRRPE